MLEVSIRLLAAAKALAQRGARFSRRRSERRKRARSAVVPSPGWPKAGHPR